MSEFEKSLKSGARLYAKDVNTKGTKFDESKTYADYSMGARWARRFTVDEHKDKINRVLNYCKSNTEAMWAATVVAILLDCDFRDSKQAIEQHFKDRGGE